MKDGFIKVAAATVEISVADVSTNTAKIKEQISIADQLGVNLLVLPLNCVTGCTCSDLVFSQVLLDDAKQALAEICAHTSGMYPTVVVSLPLNINNSVTSCAAVLHNGNALCIIPENNRYTGEVCIDNNNIPVNANTIFKCSNMPSFCFGVELGKDLWCAPAPSLSLCRAGASIIAAAAALPETVGAAECRRGSVISNSTRLACGFVYADADYSESTQDYVYSRHLIIAENGKILSENTPFGENTLIVSEIDVNALSRERIRNSNSYCEFGINTIEFNQEIRDTKITRHIEKNPFIPQNANMNERAETMLNIQSYGLMKRIAHTNAKCAVLGISGGLDSTLALLATVRSFKLLNRPLSDIKAITMPCFGTTKRTKSNAQKLCELLGVQISEVNISESVLSHFKDIGQDEDTFDVTYENAQARERTQVLMDIANQLGGLVVGTGDLSELALGWATYNGDHMSMYGINAGVPKTLVRLLVKYEADRSDDQLKSVLYDILDTPVSPELLPTDEKGDIAQKTEDLVGPYELHDFFLYHTVRGGITPEKLFRIAKIAFQDEYTDEVILHWMHTFIRRFFNQQFKRSCMPDGPKVGSVSLSPRGEWAMPTDASAQLWLKRIEALKAQID